METKKKTFTIEGYNEHNSLVRIEVVQAEIPDIFRKLKSISLVGVVTKNTP